MFPVNFIPRGYVIILSCSIHYCLVSVVVALWTELPRIPSIFSKPLTEPSVCRCLLPNPPVQQVTVSYFPFAPKQSKLFDFKFYELDSVFLPETVSTVQPSPFNSSISLKWAPLITFLPTSLSFTIDSLREPFPVIFEWHQKCFSSSLK